MAVKITFFIIISQLICFSERSIGIDDLQIGINKVQGDMAAFLAAILEATYLLTIEKLRTKINSTTIMLWCCGLGTLLSLPIFLFTEDRLFPYSVNGWVFVISLTIVDQVLGQGLLAYSLKKFSSGVVALALLLEPVLVAIAAWGIFGERLSLFDWAALFVILLGLYLAISSQPTQINTDQKNSTLSLGGTSQKPKQAL
ncbi:MAG: DMT family transporter [Microcoleaceae cyanobacterium]